MINKNNLLKFLIMSKKFYLPALVLAAIVSFSSCAKLKPLAEENVKVNPNPLETVAGEVPATIDITIPAKWFVKKGEVTVTPVLRYEGGEVQGTPCTFQGEKAKGNATYVVPRKQGGNYQMKSTFKYAPAMKKSELYLVFDAKVKKKVKKLPDLKIADGVIATSEWANIANSTPAIGADKYGDVSITHSANIMFLIEQALVRGNQLNSKEMKEWNDILKDAYAQAQAGTQKVDVEILAYASPDGPLDLNTRLSQDREKNANKELDKQMKKDKIDLPINAKYTAEDWAGFKELVEKSNMQDKDLILRVLSTYSDSEQRETKIKEMSAVFTYLADEILPQLRRAKLNANVVVLKKPDAEVKSLAAGNPQSMTVEELLYAATLTNVLSEKAAIYKKAMDLFPDDYRGFNNAGMVAYQEGKFSEAETLFKKAAQINASAPEVNVNLGLIAYMNNDKSSAQQYFGKGSGYALDEALGLSSTDDGEYAKAVSKYGQTATNNAAVAQILAKDYNKAQATLSAVPNPDAVTAYLKAVVAARTNNQSGVISNLKEAIQINSAMKKEAAIDLEFAKYFSNEDFQNLVK